MTDAIKRAAEALLNPRRMVPNDSVARRYTLAEAALEAALSDRNGMTRVLGRHVGIGPTIDRTYACSCEAWPYDERDDDTEEALIAHQVDALVAHLIGKERP